MLWTEGRDVRRGGEGGKTGVVGRGGGGRSSLFQRIEMVDKTGRQEGLELRICLVAYKTNTNIYAKM